MDLWAVGKTLIRDGLWHKESGPQGDVMEDEVWDYLLVVDDKVESLDLISRTCFPRWQVSAFQDTVEAVSFAKDHRFAAVISDFRTPK